MESPVWLLGSFRLERYPAAKACRMCRARVTSSLARQIDVLEIDA